MQPPSNAMRALAMSSRSVRTARPAARISFGRPPDELEHHLEVVDHQVPNDVHVGAPPGEGAEPVHLDEPRLREHPERRLDGRVVALDVPDLDDAPAGARDRQEAVRLGEGRGHRLLDQDVPPALEEKRRPPRRG